MLSPLQVMAHPHDIELEPIEISEPVPTRHSRGYGLFPGSRAVSFREADEQLEAFVRSAGPEHDETLIRYFHRRVLRQGAALKPAMRELEHSRVQLLE